MSKLNTFLSYIEMFIFSFLLFVFTCFLLVKITFFNRNFISVQFNSTHYDMVEKYLKDEMKRNLISSEIDDVVIDDMFTRNDIVSSTKQVLDILYYNSSMKFDTTSIENTLKTNIIKNLESKNFSMDDEAGFQDFVDSIMNIYKGEFIMFGKVSKIGSIIQKCDKLISIGTVLLGSLLALYLVFRRNKIKQLLPVALFMSSILILFGTYYINHEAGLSSITVISVTFSNILRKIIMSSFDLYRIVSYGYIVLGILLVLLLVKKRRHHRRHN